MRSVTRGGEVWLHSGSLPMFLEELAQRTHYDISASEMIYGFGRQKPKTLSAWWDFCEASLEGAIQINGEPLDIIKVPSNRRDSGFSFFFHSRYNEPEERESVREAFKEFKQAQKSVPCPNVADTEHALLESKPGQEVQAGM